MKNFFEEAEELISKHEKSRDTMLLEAEQALEEATIKYLDLKKKLIEWQAACVRAQLAIKYIKYKGKKETAEQYKTFYKKESKDGIFKQRGRNIK